MVRNYVKKTNRASINENDVAAAINDVLNGNSSLRQAAADHGIHFATLQYRVKLHKEKYSTQRNNVENEEEEEDIPDMQPVPLAVPEPREQAKYSTHQVFSPDQEAMLAEYLIVSSKLKHGLTKVELRQFAYQYALSLKLPMPPSWIRNETAGKDWELGFMKRHRQLSLRKPENTSLARSTSFNKTNVGEFFSNYKKVMSDHQFPPSRIINVDESGVTTVLQAPKVIAQTGVKQVGQNVSAERGQLVTFEGIITAEGKALPPAYIFPRKNFKEHFTIGGPEGCLGLANPSGWITSTNFLEVIKHIQKLTLSSKESPVLILFDNHESHVSLDIVEFARKNGMVLLTFPPHCSHRMQPLDVGVYGPFKSKCKVTFNEWIQKNPGKPITIYNIPQLTKKPFEEAFSTANIVSAFKKTGLWPVNEDVFTTDDFLPSYVTDRNLPSVSSSNCNVPSAPSSVHSSLPETSTSNNDPCEASSSNTNLLETSLLVGPNSPSSSALTTARVINSPCPSGNKPNPVVTPESIRPFPKAMPRVSNRPKSKGREKGKTRILTDTPEKERLVLIELEKAEKQKKKDEIERRKRKKLFGTESVHVKPKKLKTKKKKSVIEDSTTDEDNSISSGESNFILSSEEELEMEPANINPKEIGLNDFVLVKFHTRKTIKYFVGQIEALIGLEEFKVNFLRTQDKRKFVFPPNKDLSDVSSEDICIKLPPPTIIGGTERAIGGLTFKLDLSNYNMG